jgi:hypothetical protein
MPLHSNLGDPSECSAIRTAMARKYLNAQGQGCGLWFQIRHLPGRFPQDFGNIPATPAEEPRAAWYRSRCTSRTCSS